MKIIVIGAGIFGTTAALRLSKENHEITLVEMNDDIMKNASMCNHNRLHYGFHYPRSIDTARQSLDGYELFHDIFKESICNDFPNYYMIEKNSKVSTNEYIKFCDKLNLKYEEVRPNIKMDFTNIESSFLTDEPIFDFNGVRSTLKRMLEDSNVNIVLNKKITKKKELDDYDVVINTTYFNMNKINRFFNIKESLLKLQHVVIPIFKKDIEKIGLTIMDGDFCSILPKGFDKNTFLLYHVKNSVIREVKDVEIPKQWSVGKTLIKNDFIKKNIYDDYIIKEDIKKIFEVSKNYFSFLEGAEYVDYWETVRALPINNDDSRMSHLDYSEVDGKKIISLLSGKITTCWDTAENIKNLI